MISASQKSAIGAGFADPVADAQAVFRAILDATSHPGRIIKVPEQHLPLDQGDLSKAATAVALTLLDLDTPVWLDAALTSCRDFLRFHCGSPVANHPDQSRFAFAAAPIHLPALAAFDLGTPQFPERSTTVVVEVPQLDNADDVTLRGPGIESSEHIRIVGLPTDFWSARASLASLFPLGIDLIFTCGAKLAALPRTTIVEQ